MYSGYPSLLSLNLLISRHILTCSLLLGDDIPIVISISTTACEWFQDV